MIIASADESIGSSGKVLLVAAVVFREEYIQEVGITLVDVKREFGLPVEAEIHTSDIVHGKGYFSDLRSFSEREDLLDKVFKIMKLINPIIVAVWVETDISIDRRRLAAPIYEVLLERIILAFIKLTRKNEHLMLVIDETNYRNDWITDRIVEEKLSKGAYLSRWPEARKMIPRPLFLNSSTFPPLQLSDLAAYTVRRVVVEGKPKVGGVNLGRLYHEYLEPLLDRCKDGRIWGCGLKRLPKSLIP